MGNDESGQGGRKPEEVERLNESSGLLGIFKQTTSGEEEKIREKRMETGIAEILERKAQKKYEMSVKKMEDPQPKQPLLIERNATGLYYARYERGMVPNLCKGHFTHKSRLITLAKEAGVEEIKENYASSNSR